MKRAILPLMLSAVIAPASHAVITLNGETITDFDISHSNGNVYITTTGGGGNPAPTPEPEPEPEPDTEPTPPPVDSSCSAESQELVFETLDWSNQGGQTVVNSTRTVSASRFTTTAGSSFAGYVTVVPTTGTGDVTRKIWISQCPGGAPVSAKCEDTGTEARVTWTQFDNAYCDLNTNTTYYLNYQNLNGSGSLFRNFRNNNRP